MLSNWTHKIWKIYSQSECLLSYLNKSVKLCISCRGLLISECSCIVFDFILHDFRKTGIVSCINSLTNYFYLSNKDKTHSKTYNLRTLINKWIHNNKNNTCSTLKYFLFTLWSLLLLFCVLS